MSSVLGKIQFHTRQHLKSRKTILFPLFPSPECPSACRSAHFLPLMGLKFLLLDL